MAKSHPLCAEPLLPSSQQQAQHWHRKDGGPFPERVE
jgi:hypothetical protein